MSVIHSRKLSRRIERKHAGPARSKKPISNEEKISGMQDPKMVRSHTKLYQLDGKIVTSSAVFWNPPDFGKAVRLPPNKGSKTARGSMPYNGHVVPFESELEHNNLLTLMARSDIADIHGQYPVFHYVDEAGKTRSHTADFFVRFKDGYVVAVVVKMERKRSEMEALISRIKSYGVDGKVDDIRLLTEKNGSHEAAANARNVLWSRRHHNEQEVNELLVVLSKMYGFFRFGDLLWGCNNIPSRRVAVWRLIDQGVLFSTTGEEITELTWLRKTTA